MSSIQTGGRDHGSLAYSALALGIALYSVVIGYYACINHYKFHTGAYDLGLTVNYYWNTWVTGSFMKCSYCHYVPDFYYLYDHVSLLPVFVIGPFLRLFPHAETLLVAQSVLLALGALPIFLIAKHSLRDNWAALVLAGCYLLNPAMQSANFYDMHELCFLPLVYGFMIYFALRGSAFYYLFLICLLLVKEDMAIVAALFSLFLMLHLKRYRTGGLTILISLAWLLVAKFLIQGDVETFDHYFYFKELIPADGTLIDLLGSIFLDPLHTLSIVFRQEKMIFLFQMMAPFLFLPFLSVKYVILFLYGAALSLLSSHAPLYEMGFQYVFYWLTGLGVAYILVLKDIQDRRFQIYEKLNYKYILALTLICTLGTNVAYGAFSPDNFKGGFFEVDFSYSQQEEDDYRCFRSLVDRHIPPQASVLADERLAPHLSTRAEVESVRFFKNRRHFEYIALIEWNSKPYRQFIRYLQRLGNFEKVASQCRFVIYKNKLSHGVAGNSL